MMRSPAKGQSSFHLPAGALALALLLKYLGLMVYGVHAAIVEVPSFVTVGGSLFATGWAVIVATLGALAFAVVRTWMTGRFRYEKWATAGLILGFLTYSVVLCIRGVITSEWDAIPLAWLPLVVTFLPIIRYYTLVARG